MIVHFFTNQHITYIQLSFYGIRYDFNGDGLISKEDVRIVLSYIPFKRDVNPESTEEKLSSMSAEKKVKEGLYEQEEGKVLEYKDRVTD